MFETSFMDILKAISIFVLFILVFYGAYYSTRLLGKYNMKGTMNKNMKVVEAISIGVNKNLQLVKVGDSYVLLAVTKDHVSFIKEVSLDGLELTSDVDHPPIPFIKYLDRASKKRADSEENKEK